MPLGGLTDKWGRHKGIVINYCLQPVCILALAFANDFFSFFPAMSSRAIASDFGGTAWEAMLSDVTPASLCGSVYGCIGTVGISMNTIAPYFGSMVWNYFSPVWILYVSAFRQTTATLILLRFLREPECRKSDSPNRSVVQSFPDGV